MRMQSDLLLRVILSTRNSSSHQGHKPCAFYSRALFGHGYRELAPKISFGLGDFYNRVYEQQ